MNSLRTLWDDLPSQPSFGISYIDESHLLGKAKNKLELDA